MFRKKYQSYNQYNPNPSNPQIINHLTIHIIPNPQLIFYQSTKTTNSQENAHKYANNVAHQAN